MAHLAETQRIEILILIGCGDKTTIKLKQEEFLHRLVYCQQPGGCQFRTFNSLILST
jgi:hypothetical protein